MNLNTFLSYLADGYNGYQKENQSQRTINYPHDTDSIIKELKESPWSDYKYYLQQLCSMDSLYSNKENYSESFPLEDVLVKSFEICLDLTCLLYTSDAADE